MRKILFLMFIPFLCMGWWNNDWEKMKPCTLWVASGTPDSGYQVRTVVNYDADMQTDFDDIRWVDNDDATELSYWLEQKVDSDSAVYWIRVLDSITISKVPIYMYYKNISVSSESEGDSTFIFFDDFEGKEKTKSVDFGLLSSVEYGHETTEKLDSAVADFNAWDPDFVIELGDFIDRVGSNHDQALADLDTIENVYDNLSMDRYYGFGNHDLDYISKTEFISHTGMSDKYYSFDKGDYHFVVLDQCYRSDDDSDDFDSGNFDYNIAYIPPNERTWLINDLDNTLKKTIIFLEYHIVNTSGGSPTNKITNADTVKTILENSGKVIAVFGGQSGSNDKNTVNGIDYYRIRAMDLSSPNAYSKVRVYTDTSIYIEGIGEQTDYGDSVVYNLADKWTIDSGTWERTANNTLRGSTTNSYARIHASSDITNYAFHFREKVNSPYTTVMFRFVNTSNYYYYHSTSDQIKKVLAGTPSILFSLSAVDESVWHDFEIQLFGDSIEIFCDGVSLGSDTDNTFSSGQIGALVYTTGEGDQDNIRIRKFASPEPQYAFGPEEDKPTGPSGQVIIINTR